MTRDELETVVDKAIYDESGADAKAAIMDAADAYAESWASLPRRGRLTLTKKAERELAKWDAWREQSGEPC